MSAITASRSMPIRCGARRSNGRRRAARAPVASPGSMCKTSRDGWVSRCRNPPPRDDQALEVTLRHMIRTVDLAAREVLRRVDRCRALAHLEVQLRARHIAGGAGLADHLAALDGLALLHGELARMRIGGDEAVRVPHQHQVAVALELVARIGDDALLGGLDRRALRHRDIDAVVLLAVALRAEAGDHAALHGPAEARRSASAGRAGRS